MAQHKEISNLRIHHPIFHKLLGKDSKFMEFEDLDLKVPNKQLSFSIILKLMLQ